MITIETLKADAEKLIVEVKAVLAVAQSFVDHCNEMQETLHTIVAPHCAKSVDIETIEPSE